MHYFSKNFQKSLSAGGCHPQHLLTFSIDGLKFCDLAKFIFFQADFDKIKLQRHSYDVISVMSSPLHHQNNVTNFFQFGPPNQNFWLCQCSFLFMDTISFQK